MKENMKRGTILRINRYIAMAGVASRRKADELVVNGNVKVNGIARRELGYDVAGSDVVEVNGIAIKPASSMIYIMLNKPVGYITSMKDEKGRPVVTDLVTDIEERLFPVGRLDFDTSGMLLLTNDGSLANKLLHPKHNVYKTYRAKVIGVVSKERLAHLRNGVDIGGFVTAKAEAELIKQADHYAIVEIKIREGKNRQIRKMFSAVGNKVLELERIAIGDLYLGRLMTGHYRKLGATELEYIKTL